MNNSRPFLRILLGPTASGKERTALACARRCGTDIISVDSMKIYRGLDIGTAKADARTRAAIPHHCIDLVDPSEAFSLARYVETAETAIDTVTGAGKPALLSGGTALYYKGLLEGVFDGPPANPALRAALEKRAEEETAEDLFAELSTVDPSAAEKIHPNDIRRVIRALEVRTLTGRPISEQQTQWTAAEFRYPCSIVALSWPRPLLYKRSEARVDRMMEAGLLEEARSVYEQRNRYARAPLQAVGYKEFFSYFDGKQSLDEAVSLLKMNTRHLAKSQMTWFRKFPCHWLAMQEDRTTEQVADEVICLWDAAETAWKDSGTIPKKD